MYYKTSTKIILTFCAFAAVFLSGYLFSEEYYKPYPTTMVFVFAIVDIIMLFIFVHLLWRKPPPLSD